MSERIRFAPARAGGPARLKPGISPVWPRAWVAFVRAALASASGGCGPLADLQTSKLRGEAADALRSWDLPFAERHANEVLGALPHMVRAFCQQPNTAARAALAEALGSWALRCLELLGASPDAAPGAGAADPAEPTDWRVRAGLVEG